MRFVTLLLLALILTGCAGAQPVPFERVAAGKLPERLAEWQELRPEVPTILAAEDDGYLYLLLSMGDCSPPDRQIRTARVSRQGNYTLWVNVGFRRALGKAPPQPPTSLIRIKLAEVEQNDKSGFTLQEKNMRAFYAVQSENPEGAAWDRTYLVGDRYECRVPIR